MCFYERLRWCLFNLNWFVCRNFTHLPFHIAMLATKNNFETVWRLFKADLTIVLPVSKEISNFCSIWKSRIGYSLYSLSNQEPVLKVRRTLFSLALDLIPERDSTRSLRQKLRSELSECWILSAKVSRKAGQVKTVSQLDIFDLTLKVRSVTQIILIGRWVWPLFTNFLTNM